MALGQVQDFYGAADTFSDLTRRQSNASVGQGYEAARLADPFSSQRPQYENALSKLVSNPGDFSSSPFYKFAYDQGLNALERKGNVRSGNKLAELERYGQGMASQSYFPQAQLLSTLSGATTGSPAAAGLTVGGAFNRSQDLASISAANKASGMGGIGGGGGYGTSAQPWWMAPSSTKMTNASPEAMTGTYNIGGGYSPQYQPYDLMSGGGSGGGYSPYSNYDYSGYSPSGMDYNDGYGGYDYSGDYGY